MNLQKKYERACTGFIWFMIVTSGSLHIIIITIIIIIIIIIIYFICVVIRLQW